MRYILDREGQCYFLMVAIDEQVLDDKAIMEMVEGCKYYDFEIHGNCYFLSKDIQTKLGKEEFKKNYVDLIYQFTDDSNFFIEEISSNFVDFMLQNYSIVDQDIDIDIYDIHENYLRRYGR